MVPSVREAHLAVLMIGYSDPLTRRLASSVRPSPPDAWCAVGWRLQGQRSAQRKGSSGWPQMPAPVRRPKAEAISGGDPEALAEALGKQARVRRSRVFRAASTEISGAITPTRMRISHERSSWARLVISSPKGLPFVATNQVSRRRDQSGGTHHG